MEIELTLEHQSNGCLIFLNEAQVGSITFTKYSNQIHIDSFLIERPYRRKGIGFRVIDELKRNYSVMTGESNPLAINFWKKVGAEFEEDVTEEWVDDLMELGVYPAFIIT